MFLAPVVVLLLTLGAIASVWLVVQRADSSRKAQVQIALMTASLSDLKTAPYSADPNAGGAAASHAQTEINDDQQALSRGLTARDQAGVPLALLATGRASLATVEPVVASVYRIAAGKGGLAASGLRVLKLQRLLLGRVAVLSGVLGKLSQADAS